jgi:hypothetical protein
MAKAAQSPEGIVTLEMSEVEASTLMVILDHINGDPKNSPRKWSDEVYFALVGATDLEPEFLPQHALMANHEALGFSFMNDDGTTPPALQRRIDEEKNGVQAYGSTDDLQAFLDSLQ